MFLFTKKHNIQQISQIKRLYLIIGLSLTWLYVPFQWHYFITHNVEPSSIFMLNTIFCISAVIFEIPFGILADIKGRKFSIIIEDVIYYLFE